MQTPRAQRTSTDAQTWEFSHHKFLRGRPDLLDEIKRKALEPDPSVKHRVELPGEVAAQLGAMREQHRRVVKALEEERRLAYVGLTRARRQAVVSSAANRQVYGNWTSSIPSRFLDELPPEQVQREGSAAVTRGRAVEIPSVFTGTGGLSARRRVIDQGAWEVRERPAPADAPAVGERVFHQKFGYGEVLAVDDNKLDVEFATGRKRVLSSFVEKA